MNLKYILLLWSQSNEHNPKPQYPGRKEQYRERGDQRLASKGIKGYFGCADTEENSDRNAHVGEGNPYSRPQLKPASRYDYTEK